MINHVSTRILMKVYLAKRAKIYRVLRPGVSPVAGTVVACSIV
jgi:hypothetical protein